MYVTFLGTGSGTPSAHRNVTGVVVHMGSRYCLFDCGEGTQHQLRKAGVSFLKIDAVMVSHVHGDHIFGLPGLLGSMSLMQRETPLTIVGPQGIRAYLEQVFAASCTHLSYPLQVRELTKLAQATSVHSMHGFDINSISIKHRVPAFAYRAQGASRPGRFHADAADRLLVPHNHLRGQLCRGQSITLADGRTVLAEQVLDPPRPGKAVTICTDTEYCAQSIDLSNASDLLIHESTYAEKHRDLAIRGGHSTSHDAARVAKAAGVKKLALTHFSPRYDNMDDVLAGVADIFPAVVVAEDLLQLQV